MALMDKAQLKEFIKTNNIKTAEDIQVALRDMFKDTLQGMLEAELDSDLGYIKHDEAGKNWARQQGRLGYVDRRDRILQILADRPERPQKPWRPRYPDHQYR